MQTYYFVVTGERNTKTHRETTRAFYIVNAENLNAAYHIVRARSPGGTLHAHDENALTRFRNAAWCKLN